MTNMHSAATCWRFACQEGLRVASNRAIQATSIHESGTGVLQVALVEGVGPMKIQTDTERECQTFRRAMSSADHWCPPGNGSSVAGPSDASVHKGGWVLSVRF